jgi:uncharacterized membrane protein YkvA (DUF1232 family)
MSKKNNLKKIDTTFLETKISKVDDEDVEKVIQNEQSILQKIKNNPSFKKYRNLIYAMIQMVKDTKNGIYKQTPWFTIATIIVVLLYILNPLDIIPDFVPGLGYLDDASVFALALKWISKDIDAYLDWKLEDSE